MMLPGPLLVLHTTVPLQCRQMAPTQEENGCAQTARTPGARGRGVTNTARGVRGVAVMYASPQGTQMPTLGPHPHGYSGLCALWFVHFDEVPTAPEMWGRGCSPSPGPRAGYGGKAGGGGAVQ